MTDEQKQQVQIKVFEKGQYGDEWPPEAAADYIAWFQAKVAQIPEEYRAAARIEIESDEGYEGSHYGTITISYWRVETDEEVAARCQKNAIWRANRERELAYELERLRALK